MKNYMNEGIIISSFLIIVMFITTLIPSQVFAYSAASNDTNSIGQSAAQNSTLPVSDIGLADNIQDGAIFHTWCWSFNTIKENLTEIAAAGFTTIQTSPIAQCLEGENGAMQIVGQGKWYYHYQPTKYVIGNYQMGTKDEFTEMCEAAHELGMYIIADTVINHCTMTYDAIDSSLTDIEGGGFHDTKKEEWSQNNRYELTQHYLSGLYDLNTQNPNIQQLIKDFLVDCVQAGADGFRYDAAKLIELPDDYSEGFPEFASEFWPVVLDNGAIWQYGEDLQEGGEDATSSRLKAYSELMSVTASYYGERVREAVGENDFSVNYIQDFLVGDVNTDKLVTWVESHDNYCNDASYSELDAQDVIRGWSLIAAREGGTPLFFDRPMNSTASKPWGNNLIGATGSDMYKDPQVVAVNFFRNAMTGEPEYLTNPTGDAALLFIERGDKGLVIINASGEDVRLNEAAVTHMADGAYTDQAYGSSFVVADGKITGTVKAGKTAIIYNRESASIAFSPAVSLSIPTSVFLTDDIEVEVQARGCVSSTYQIDDSEPVVFTGAETITLGENLKAGESVILSVKAITPDNNVLEASATYTKQIAKGTTIVYLAKEDFPEWVQGIRNAYVHAEEGAYSNALWPGVKMTDMGNGYYKYVLPYDFEVRVSYVIFNDTWGNQSDSFEIHPDTQMVYENGRWKEYTENKSNQEYLETAVEAAEIVVSSNRYELDEAMEVYCRVIDEANVLLQSSDIADEQLRAILDKLDAAKANLNLVQIDVNGTSVIYLAKDEFSDWLEGVRYAYVYAADNSGPNAAWPGILITDQEDGYYKYVLPSNLESKKTYVIFNDNNGNQYPQNSAGLIMQPGTKMVLEDGQWIEYQKNLIDLELLEKALKYADDLIVSGIYIDDWAMAVYKEIVVEGKRLVTDVAVTDELINELVSRLEVAKAALNLIPVEEKTVVYLSTAEFSQWTQGIRYAYVYEANIETENPDTYALDIEDENIDTLTLNNEDKNSNADIVHIPNVDINNITVEDMDTDMTDNTDEHVQDDQVDSIVGSIDTDVSDEIVDKQIETFRAFSINENAAWPGELMTDLGNGYYKYVLPAGLADKVTYVIFGDGNGNQYPQDSAGLLLQPNTRMVYENGVWKEYIEITAIDKRILEDLILVAEGKKETAFTTESWRIFAAVLEKSKVAAGDAAASQNDIDSAIAELQEAIKNLVEKGNEILTIAGIPKKIYVGDIFTLTPNIIDQEVGQGWEWDSVYLQLAYNMDKSVCVTALKSGTTTITYIAKSGISKTLSLNIMDKSAPKPSEESDETQSAGNKPIPPVKEVKDNTNLIKKTSTANTPVKTQDDTSYYLLGASLLSSIAVLLYLRKKHISRLRGLSDSK